jgi:xylulokinase
MTTSGPGHVVAVDLGTTGLKVAVVDPQGRVLGHAGEVLPLLFGAEGAAEQDPEGWWQALGRSVRHALDRAVVRGAQIGLVAVTSQYTSTVAVAADGRPLANAVMWMDARAGAHSPFLASPGRARRWAEVHGAPPSPGGRPAQVAFIRNEWPDVHDAAAAFVEPMDALAARLTGHVTATQGTMFPLGVIDNATWGVTEYDDELVGIAGVDPDRLPPLVPLGAPRGRLTTAAAEHLGLTTAALVAGATIDSVTSAVGTGARLPTRCGLIIGTTSVVATHVPSPRSDPAHGLFTAPSPLPHSWFVVAENGIGGKALDVLVRNLIYPDDGLGSAMPDDAFRRVVAAAAGVPAGANGVMFLPWLVGSMAPGFERHLRGAFANLGLTSARVDLARAVLEGVALNAAWLIPFVTDLAGSADRSISFGGGGAASAVWGQILADVLGAEVRRLAEPQVTNAHGAALLALVEAERLTWDDADDALCVEQVHQPDPAVNALYRRSLAAFVDAHDRWAPTLRILHTPLAAPPASPSSPSTSSTPDPQETSS